MPRKRDSVQYDAHGGCKSAPSSEKRPQDDGAGAGGAISMGNALPFDPGEVGIRCDDGLPPPLLAPVDIDAPCDDALLGAGEDDAPWDGGVGSLLGPGDPSDDDVAPCDVVLLGAGEAGAPWDGGMGSLLGPGDPGNDDVAPCDVVLLGAGEDGAPWDGGMGSLLGPGDPGDDDVAPCDVVLLGAGEDGTPWDGGMGSLLGPGDPGDDDVAPCAPWDDGVGSLLGPGDPGDDDVAPCDVVLLGAGPGAGEYGTPSDEGLLEPGDEITPCDDGEDTAVDFNDDGAGAGAVCKGAASPPAMAPEDAGITVHAECVNVPLQESKLPSLHVRVCVSALQI